MTTALTNESTHLLVRSDICKRQFLTPYTLTANLGSVRKSVVVTPYI